MLDAAGFPLGVRLRSRSRMLVAVRTVGVVVEDVCGAEDVANVAPVRAAGRD